MPIQITGVRATLKAMKAQRAKDGTNIANGLMSCAKTLFNKSQELVPVDTGDLKASGHVWQYGVGMGAVSAVVYDAEHAWVVHEDTSKYHDPPTQAKYLQDAIPKVRGTMVARLKRQIQAGVSSL